MTAASTQAPNAPAVPRPAATMILLREAAQGPEVLLLRRHSRSDVHGGAYVFPGGKVDAADARLDAPRHLNAPPEDLHHRLGGEGIDVATAMGLYVAGVREAFEESGLLLAQDLAPGMLEAAAARLRSGVAFNALLDEFGLRLQVNDMAPWSRWITPPHIPKRFDTWFFVARAPEGIARQDNHEATEAVWVRPRAALESYWSGRMPLVPPQIMTLAHLARYGSLEAVLAEAGSRPPPVVAPHLVEQGAQRVLCYPGDEAHPVKVRAMPGPLRLVSRQNRYEPLEAGFEGFFA